MKRMRVVSALRDGRTNVTTRKMRLMFKTIIGSTIGSGGGIAALWWMINRTYQINGVGWLERQPFPLNNVWIFATVGAVSGFVLGVLRHRRNVQLREELAEVSERGEVEIATATEEFELPPMQSFANLHSVDNRIARTQNGIRIYVLDATTVQETDSANRYTRRTVVLLPAEGLAHFNLNAKTIGYRLLAWIGAHGVTFDSSAGSTPEDRAAIEAFGRHYQLTTGDATDLAAGTPGIYTEEDEAARQAFSLRVLKWLVQHPGWSMESHGGHLALWRGKETPSARRRLAMIDDALAVLDRLNHPDIVVPARPGTDRSWQSARFQGALLGGVIGVFASFFIGFITTISVLFNRKPDVRDGFPFEILLFPTILVIGALLGIFIGSRLPISQPLLQKPKDPKLEKRVGCAVLFGLFGGFLGGAAVGAILGIILDLGMDQHVFRMTLFFGGAGLGFFIVPVVCGVLAKKFLERFQREKE